MMSGILGMMVVLGANVRYIEFSFAAGGLFVVAPIYFVVMPWPDGGIGLFHLPGGGWVPLDEHKRVYSSERQSVSCFVCNALHCFLL